MIFIHAPVGEHHGYSTTVPVGTIHLHKQPVMARSNGCFCNR